METVVQSPTYREEEFRFLIDWRSESDRVRSRKAGMASILVHFLAIVALLFLPQVNWQPPAPRQTAQARRITPLIAPLAEPTQNVPNKGKISKEINADSLAPRPRIQIPPSLPSTTRPAAPKPSLPLRTNPAPAVPEPPKIETGGSQPKLYPEAPQVARVSPPPQIQAQEKPKLVLESPSAPSAPRGLGKLAAPDTSVSQAVRSVAHGGVSGGLMVGDTGIGLGGIGEAANLPPSPGKSGSNLELLSDPMGIDFRPYLIAVLATVKRNWFAVMPESALMGRKGKVGIQFAVNRDGGVPKLVIVLPSGTDALDRAAVAGISASNPFPPLPSEFRGPQIRLQFTFLYNMAR